MRRCGWLMGAVLATGFAQTGSAGTDTIALSGQQAGGAPLGAVFSSFGAPVLNQSGQVAFEGFLMPGVGGVTTANNNGIWRDSTLIAREGFQAGGTPLNAVFGSLGNPVLNDAGQVAYEGFLLSGGGGVTFANDNGIWLDTALIAREGFQAGGTPAGAVFNSFDDPVLNNAGQVAFEGFLLLGVGGVDATNNNGIWRDATLIAREDSAAGGTPFGAVFSFFSGNIVLNEVGQVAYEAFLRPGVGGVDGTNDNGIWRDSDLIAREGSQAGGVAAGVVFNGFGSPALNDAGQVAFEGFLLQSFPDGIHTANDSGIWRDSTIIAREGSQAGGTPSGAVFDFFDDPVLNNAGHVAFAGFLLPGVGGVHSANNSGLWRDSTLLAREGSQASGAPAGAVFNSFVSSPVLNDQGQTAFLASLRVGVGGVDATNDRGIWIAGTNGESLLAVREGDILEGRTVSSLSFRDDTGGSDGRGRALNNFSQLTYLASFTNGDSGIFLYTPDIHWTRTFSSSWDSSINWTIGQLPGDPHDVFIDPDVSLSVTGPSQNIEVNSLTLGGNNGIATLRLNGGTITVNSSLTITSTGILTGDGIIDGGATIINSGTVIADNLTLNSIFSNNGLITGDGRLGIFLNNNAGGEVRVAAGDHLIISSGGQNGSRIEVLGGEIEFNGSLSNSATNGLITGRDAVMRFNAGLTNRGALAISFGTSDIFGDINNNATGSIVLSGGSNTTFYDDITNNGSIIVASVGSVSSNAVFFGDVSGAGSITGGGNVFLHGDLRPGNSPAAVFHDVNLFLMSTSSTVIEIGGTTPGSQHDQINNAKTTTIGGTLDIQLINGFTPDAGDVFDIFIFAAQSGTFADVLLPTIDGDLGWNLRDLYTDGELRVELAGDLNSDGFVGDEDLNILLASWGNSAAAFDYAAGDASGDGIVGNADLQIVLAHFGNGTAPGSTIPEPGSLALLGLGGLALMRRRQ